MIRRWEIDDGLGGIAGAIIASFTARNWVRVRTGCAGRGFRFARSTDMAKPWDIDDELWVRVNPMLPVHRPGKRRPVPLDDRKCLQSILFVLYTGINWKHLPPELGFGSGITCWRRFRRA
ncbi:transposase [Glycomyces sp. NEAU-S30]|uniref:Transposase n=1 Tax=Glycomyces niveus TaxID=2820287 RepID=A0ABS3UAB6_9ACTN|nr:transposase [Glycomyces sp. NEAU-S30]MBO3735710.1 transposase [Glycomyces sp. NEAU-S30]